MKGLDPKLYTKDYYLTDCSGFDEYKKTFGKKLDVRLKYTLSFVKITKGTKVLDVGCGRGEVALWAAKKGAEVVGIDYSKAAIKLAKKALKKQPGKIQKNIRFFVKNAKEINFPPNSFDTIFLTDVLEHLYPEEQRIVLKTLNKILKKNGVVYAHTEPNRIYVDYTYPLWSYPTSTSLILLWKLVSGKDYPNIPHPSTLRTESHKQMHINEPTYLNLKKTFNQAGFITKIVTKVPRLKPVLSWKDWLNNFIVHFHPFSSSLPFNILFANDFIIIAKKK